MCVCYSFAASCLCGGALSELHLCAWMWIARARTAKKLSVATCSTKKKHDASVVEFENG